ncbi:unnamed protein product [Medioppia subpectinata]|uniref:Nucleoporin Nup188 N-terminal subdomain III domain-containing protein n=1 Tax=Medioppia subpectinata TaxID=1979941 RepID=A0A7R9KMM5_9ACAR|nr:unnamed protein product [Medioppia subpectinata]CAG2105344.1 unnamed protein product [Medioppia subpectinata]
MATNGSTAPQVMAEPKSMKTLFTLLSGSVALKSEEFIAEELNNCRHQLANGLLYYLRHNPAVDSLSELKKRDSSAFGAFTPELMSKASLLLDLSHKECNELFNSYLCYEFKGTPESMKQLFSNEKQSRRLLYDLNDYYRSERLFTLFCLKQILSHWSTSSEHMYQHIFRSFLETINDSNQLYPKLVEQLVHLNECPVPSRLSNGPYFTESLAKEHLHHNLREQTEILELLLLYIKGFETSMDNIIELLSLFASNGFGVKFAHFNRTDCDYIGEEVFKFIGFLQSLVIVECLDLKWLYECQEKDIECQLMKADNVKQLKKLDSLVVNLNSVTVEHSPIFMSWMIVRSWESADPQLTATIDAVPLLGATAVQLNVFGYLEKCLNLPQVIALNGTVVSDLIHRAISDLLSVTFNVFNIEMLRHSVPALNQLCIKLFRNSYIASDLFKHGLDSGLGLIVSSALQNFPLRANPVLSFCQSLSETNYCKQIFEKLTILSNLTTFTEPFDSSLSTCVPTEEDSIYCLLRDKLLFRNTELVIRKETKGLLKIVNNSRAIEWMDTNIDGWKLIYHRFREQYDLVSRGQLHSVSEIAINEMSQITTICSNLIKNNCSQHISAFNRLITLCLETYDLFSSVENPPRLLMASILELTAAMIAVDYSHDTASLWQRINGKSFMPYMIGLTSDLKEVIAGNDTNTSLLGQLIASEECIKGRYELCIAFLKLIAQVVKKSDLKDDNNLTASLVFIIKEIFPSHYFWSFNNQNEFFKIGRLCFDIFHTVLSKSDYNSNRCRIGELCTSALMDGNASQTLLNVIKSGETSVRNVIMSAGNDNSLSDDDQIVIVRQSLSILNYLLILTTTPNNTSDKSCSHIETAVFSTQSKPNMLLILSHYVLQRYDTQLATLAVQLLRQLAKRFPMSMLACLGSDAESMREHFLFRLDQVTEDLHFKVALLNFLSSCVERQPGLMEMFLNVDNNPLNDKSDNNTTGCLQTVLEILSEKREAKYTYPFELHLAALKFLYTFWVGPLEDRDKFDCDLETKFKTLRDTNRLKQFSAHIQHLFESVDLIPENSRLLLNAWKDFLISIAKFDPFGLTKELKMNISEDIIDSLLVQLRKPHVDNNIIAIFADILLTIFDKWKETCIESPNEWHSRVEQLLKCIEEVKESDSKLHNLKFKLSVTSIALLQTLVNQNSTRVSIWIQVLRTHFLMESLANLLNYLIENKLGVELSVHIMSLFVELSSIQLSAEALYLTGFVDNLCISLQNTYITTPDNVITKDKCTPTVKWINVFYLSLRMITNLVNQLKHHFVDIGITFVAIHLDHIIDILTKVRTNPKTEEIYESIQMITLCHSISRYHEVWRTHHHSSFQEIEQQILKTSHSVIAFLIRPNFLSYIMENPNTSAAIVVSSEATPKRVSPPTTTSTPFDGKALRKSVSWEQEFTTHSIDAKLLDSLFTFQAFSVHIMSLFVELSSIQLSAEALYLTGFVDNLCISLQNTYITTPDTVITKDKCTPTVKWINVFYLSLRMTTNLVNQLKHHFVDIGITFVAIHLDHIIDILTKVRTNPKTEEIYESIQMITLCHSISRYHEVWRTHHPSSFKAIEQQILKTSHSVIAFLIRPNFLSYIMENPNTSAAIVVSSKATPKRVSSPTTTTSTPFDGKALRKSVSWEQEFTTHSIDAKLLDSLFTFQAFSIAFLQNISPNVLVLMERQGFDPNDWKLLIRASFSSPNIDPNSTLSFGSLINCIHMCIKTLNRREKEKQTLDFVAFIFETSLSFMVSQAMVAQLSSTIPDVDKQIIVREIKSELSTILSNVGGGRTRRISQSLSVLSSPKSAATSLIEEKYVKFLLQFFDKISQ